MKSAVVEQITILFIQVNFFKVICEELIFK